jgi:hypothetical protein
MVGDRFGVRVLGDLQLRIFFGNERVLMYPCGCEDVCAGVGGSAAQTKDFGNESHAPGGRMSIRSVM